jgi:hypothetical protein
MVAQGSQIVPKFPHQSPSVTRGLKKTTKSNQNKPKSQNVYIKAQFESPKHLHQTTF